MNNHDVIELPMSHMTMRERIFLYLRMLTVVTVLVFMAIGTNVPYFTLLGYIGLTIIAVLIAYLVATKISHTRFDFSNKTIRLYYAHNPFRKFIDYDCGRFEIVLSEGRPRLYTVTVKLTGRDGSVAVTAYGPSDTYITNDSHRLDHPKAHELRCYLAQRLNLRNIGSI